ncbi:MAG: hypothetical protein ACOC38_12620 [Promethearchaeia archaeon]
MESGTFWWHRGSEIVELSVNSTQTQVNVSIDEVMLNITHFNVSQANASVLIRAQNGTLFYNQTEISGTLIDGFTSRSEIPSSSVSRQTFIVTILREGTNTTVSFEYWRYGLISWTGVPYAVVSPGFYMIVGIGLLLVAASSILFLTNSWQYGRAEDDKLQGFDYLILLVGFLLPAFSKIRFASDQIAYIIQSPLWYYVHYLIVGSDSYVGSTISPRPHYFAIASLLCNALLVISFWLERNRGFPKRVFQGVFWVSFIALIGATFFSFVAAYIPVRADFLFVPAPILQAGIWLLNREGNC